MTRYLTLLLCLHLYASNAATVYVDTMTVAAANVANMGMVPTPPAPITPTNLPNAVSISWWSGDNYITNAGVPTITDYGPGNFALTNLGGAGSWPTYGGTLNGHAAIRFGTPSMTSTFLRSINYTASQPHTICMVMRLDDADTVGKTIFSSANTTNGHILYEAGGTAAFPKKFYVYAGNVATVYINTNTWTLVECLYASGSTGVFYTNSVISATNLTVGAQTENGITIGASTTGGNGTYWLCAGIMTYSTALTYADRAALYNWAKTTFGAVNFP